MKAHKHKLFLLNKHSNQFKIYKFHYYSKIKLKFINFLQIDKIKPLQQIKQFKILIKRKMWKHQKSRVEMNSQIQAQAVTQKTLTSQL